MLHSLVLKIQTLASGSRGNVTYIASDTTSILVDVGLSLPGLLKRMKDANINPEQIDAILITHEHSDHIMGLTAFLRKYKTAVHIHEIARGTVSAPAELLKTFNSRFEIGDISVDFFSVPHDSQFCFGYTFQNEDAKISVATDLGRAGAEVLAKMAGSQIVMLESNHDLGRLNRNTKYPVWLKRRIAGGAGHLSNTATSLAVAELYKLNVQQVILAHLSQENNSPNLAYSYVRDYLASKGITEGSDISIDVATQDEISVVFQID